MEPFQILGGPVEQRAVDASRGGKRQQVGAGTVVFVARRRDLQKLSRLPRDVAAEDADEVVGSLRDVILHSLVDHAGAYTQRPLAVPAYDAAAQLARHIRMSAGLFIDFS